MRFPLRLAATLSTAPATLLLPAGSAPHRPNSQLDACATTGVAELDYTGDVAILDL
ncbi:hypothetical protein ACIF6L_38105 [Kitasatospora sp. NPDC086009]|uniref:hypothetical protein n=1 Tax=unclassified Kitasatospora TaxID=2633591 RepID=UPI0036F192B7